MTKRPLRLAVVCLLAFLLVALTALPVVSSSDPVQQQQEETAGKASVNESGGGDVNEIPANEQVAADAVNESSGGKTENEESAEVEQQDEEEYVDEEAWGDEEEGEEVQYFYYDLEDKPVVEFQLAPEEEEGDPWIHHEFLRKPDPEYHHIVEFYAHWCPHCWHLRDQYINFARTIKDVAKDYNVPIKVFAVSCVPFRPVCQHFKVDGYPKIYLFKKNETSYIELGHDELHPYAAMGKIGLELDMDNLPDEETDEESVASSKVAEGGRPGDNFFLPRKKKDIYNDAYLSFHFAMKNGIFKSPGPLSNTTLDIFTEFVDLVKATVPPTFRLRKLADEILKNIDEVSQSEKALVELVDKYPPKKKTWSYSCTRGKPSAGYTCGLWQLFHIVTIGLVEFNAMVAAEDDYPYYRSADAALALRNFIENFFDCEVCRTHFLKDFDGCAYDGCHRLIPYVGEIGDWMHFPMWLHEFHNGVNTRLMKERAEREGWKPTLQDEMDVQWPSRKDCPICWYDDGTAELNNIYIFLRLAYWPEDVFTENMKKDLLTSELAMKLAMKREKRAFSGRVVGVLLVLMVIAGGYFYEKRRRMRRSLDKVKKDP